MWRNYSKSITLYSEKTVHLQEWHPTKVWQESIFDDEIIGGYHITVHRPLDEREKKFLEKNYGHLDPAESSVLEKRLTQFHSGEMEAYYVMRHGFCEGHTDYRVDPIAVARIFGLKTLKEIEEAFPSRLHEVLTRHFTR